MAFTWTWYGDGTAVLPRQPHPGTKIRRTFDSNSVLASYAFGCCILLYAGLTIPLPPQLINTCIQRKRAGWTKGNGINRERNDRLYAVVFCPPEGQSPARFIDLCG